MADKADRGTSEIFFVKMSVNSPENVLTHDSSYSFRFYGVNAPWNQSMSVQGILL